MGGCFKCVPIGEAALGLLAKFIGGGLAGSKIAGFYNSAQTRLSNSRKDKTMAILHAQAGEVVDIRPLGVTIADSKTTALIKTHQFEIIRMVLLENKEIPVHAAKGNIIVQCVEGHVTFSTMGKNVELTAGHIFHLKACEPHSLKAVEDSSLLLTILFHSDASVTDTVDEVIGEC